MQRRAAHSLPCWLVHLFSGPNFCGRRVLPSTPNATCKPTSAVLLSNTSMYLVWLLIPFNSHQAILIKSAKHPRLQRVRSIVALGNRCAETVLIYAAIITPSSDTHLRILPTWKHYKYSKLQRTQQHYPFFQIHQTVACTKHILIVELPVEPVFW